MAITKSSLKFVLTSLEPEVAQTSRSQSLGGYAATVSGSPSASLVYPETTLTSNVYLDGTTLPIASASAISSALLVSVNDEIIRLSGYVGDTGQIETRAGSGERRLHLTGDVVRGLTSHPLFNEDFNSDFKQYRCLALMNTSATETAYNVSIHLRRDSLNPTSRLRVAVEIPRNDYLSSTSTGGSTLIIRDSSLVGNYDNDHFSSANLRILSGSNSGQTRVVASFDAATGAFVVDSALPFAVSAGVSYVVEPGPAQRVASGTISPVFASGRVSALSDESDGDGIGINVTGGRDHGSELRPNDIVYVWIERSLGREAEAYADNSVVISARYTT